MTYLVKNPLSHNSSVLRGTKSCPFFAKIDDKHIPLYRVIWVSDLPHFCGESDCMREGQYEVRLEQGEDVWASREERDELLEAMERWQGGMLGDEEDWENE